MFELTNEQRKCFALLPVNDNWERIEAKSSPYDNFKTFLYVDGDTVVKCILIGDDKYCEYEFSEKITSDKKFLLPKTSKGKPVLLSSSNILKRSVAGMALAYEGDYVCLWNDKSECNYYSNSYIKEKIRDINSFSQWVSKWCDETSEDDLKDVVEFSQRERKHIKYQEGDVFRFKIGRKLYGYGRILLDYDKMRKKKEEFWDILMCKPLVCSVYHIATERSDVSIDELKLLPSLPSSIITDNSLYYGEFEIIGNLPIADNEDYPIMYGNSIHFGETAACYQCGKVYRKSENTTVLYGGFTNNGVSFGLNFTLEVLMQCVNEGSNEPYWKNYYPVEVERDLRNPKHADKLQKIREYFGL